MTFQKPDGTIDERMEEMFLMIKEMSPKVNTMYIVLKGDDKNRDDFGLEGDIKELKDAVKKNTEFRYSFKKNIVRAVWITISGALLALGGGIYTRFKGVW